MGTFFRDIPIRSLSCVFFAFSICSCELLGVRIESASRIILLTAPVPKHKPQSTLF